MLGELDPIQWYARGTSRPLSLKGYPIRNSKYLLQTSPGGHRNKKCCSISGQIFRKAKVQANLIVPFCIGGNALNTKPL
jgi:hypothetical protein